MLLAAVIFLIFLALAFDFINGFHDAANSIATVVSTRVLSPFKAVLWAAFFNFIAVAPILWGVTPKVANTMGKGVIHFDMLRAKGSTEVLVVIFAALMGAIVWNLLTWLWGLPSSSSHALAGGLIGATLPSLGPGGLIASGIGKIVAFIVLSPLMGFVIGSAMAVLTAWVVRRRTPWSVDHWFRKLQLLSAALFSYSHGTNDAQKVMGIISVILYGSIWSARVPADPNAPLVVPFWVAMACGAAIGVGTMFGGWRIVKTMGQNLTKLAPIGGFSAESGAGATIITMAHFGIPVSTTHTITGAIVGVGSTKGTRAVRWGVAGKIVWAWIITIPASAAVAAVAYFAAHGVVALTH